MKSERYAATVGDETAEFETMEKAITWALGKVQADDRIASFTVTRLTTYTWQVTRPTLEG